MSIAGLESSSSESPLTAKHNLKEKQKISSLTIQIKLSEINYNKDLVKLLAYCEAHNTKSPVATSASESVTTCIKSLIAKHQELVGCLDSINDPNFYIYFVVWLNDASSLYQQYINNFDYSANRDDSFLKPITRLKFFIDLINQLLMILQKNLNKDLSTSFNEILVVYFRLLDQFDNKYNKQKLDYQLNSINFGNIKSLITLEPISSFFKSSNITKRDFAKLDIQHPLGNSSSDVEMLLLSNSTNEIIIDSTVEKVDSLAFCSVKKEANNVILRSLMFPPLRINELSILSIDDTEILLTPVLMSSLSSLITPVSSNFKFEKKNEITLKLTGEKSVLGEWIKYLEILFPSEIENNFNQNYNESFMKTFTALKELSYNGLGIQLQEQRYPTETNFSNLNSILNNSTNTQLKSNKSISPPKFHVPKIATPPTIKEEDEEEEEELLDDKSSHEFTFINKEEELQESSSSPFPEPTIDDESPVSLPMPVAVSVPIKDLKVKPILKKTYSANPSRRSSIYKTDASMSLSALLDDTTNPNEPLTLAKPPQLIMKHSNNSGSSLMSAQSEPLNHTRNANVNSSSNYAINEKDEFEISQNGSFYSVTNNTSSTVDLSNFGKDFTPNFNFNKSKKEKRKTVFDFFKRKPATSKKVHGFEIVQKEQVRDTQMSFPSLQNSNDLSQDLEELSIKKPRESSNDKRNKQHLTVETDLLGPPSIFKMGNRNSPLSTGKSANFESNSSIPSPFSLSSIPENENLGKLENDNTKIKLDKETKNIIDISPEIYNGVAKISQWKLNKWEKVSDSYLYLRIFLNLDQGLILGYECDSTDLDEIDIDNDDKPSVIIFLDSSSSIKKSNALDIQINSKDSTGKSNLFLIRCNSSSETEELLKNLNFALADNDTNLSNSKKQYSNNTIRSNSTVASSIMSKASKQSASQSSTLTSISSIYNSQDVEFLKPPNSAAQSSYHTESPNSFTTLDSINSSPISLSGPRMKDSQNGQLLLLNTTKVRLHKQLKSYEFINDSKSWSVLGMPKLELYSIVSKPGFYQLIIDSFIDCEIEKDQIERIGKAGLLLKIHPSAGSLDGTHCDLIYMIETKGKKQATTLYDLISYQVQK